MPVPSQADPRTSADAANDPALMDLCYVGVGHRGDISRAVGGYRFLYVVIDKFTKWLEATPVVNINKQSTVNFIKSIICRFGVPNRIITDNGSQFTSGAFQGYCEDLGI
jgi:transposase InsO family protein